jgi:PPOX class probable F420-dependent enzyme
MPAAPDPPAWALERFAGARVARLATLHEGSPRIVPVTFAWTGTRAVWAVDDVKPKRPGRRLRRLDDLAADPRVSLLADHYDEDWSRLWWVELLGEAAELAGPDVEEARTALLARYDAYARRPPPGPYVAVEPVGWRWWAATPPDGNL